MARIKVSDVAFALVETKEFELEWYKENQLLNLQEEAPQLFKAGPKQINYPGIMEEMAKIETQMTDCIQQYEERLKRVNEYMEQSN